MQEYFKIACILYFNKSCNIDITDDYVFVNSLRAQKFDGSTARNRCFKLI